MEKNKASEMSMIGDVWMSDEPYRNLLTLCDDFGSRFAGTEGEKKAVDFLSKKLKEYGLSNVKAEPFKYIGWRRGKAKLELLSPLYKDLHAISLVLSPSTSPEGVEGEVIYVGMGTPEEFVEKKEDIKGKIVLCSTAAPTSRQIHRRTKYGYAVKYGATAFIFMSHRPGQLPETGSLRPAYKMVGEIPGVGISKEVGEFMLRQAQKGKLRARIILENQITPGTTSWNVVGEIPGTDYLDHIIVVGAHYDGHDISQGAMDNATGVCVVLEAARTLAKHADRQKRTIRFICFGVEEFATTGSTDYVADHEEETSMMDLMINCDGAGRGEPHFIVCQPVELIDYMKRFTDEINHPISPTVGISTASDHWPFFMKGVPTIRLSHYRPPETIILGRGFGHTPADTVDKVDMAPLKEASIFLARFLLRAANEDESVARHVPLDEIIERLEKQSIAEELRIQKMWHPESVR